MFQNIMTHCSRTLSCRWVFTLPAADTSCTPPAGRGETMQSVTSLQVQTHSTYACALVCRYFEEVQLKEQRRQQRLRGHNSYDVENGEFLCPLCECLSNTVIPLLPHTHTPDRRYAYTQARVHTDTQTCTPGPCTSQPAELTQETLQGSGRPQPHWPLLQRWSSTRQVCPFIKGVELPASHQ